MIVGIIACGTYSLCVKPKIDAATSQYVTDRLRERHEKVRAWRDTLIQKIESGYEATSAELEADLTRVMPGSAPGGSPPPNRP